MNNPIKISVVIPIYNAERTLGKCIDCLLDQTLPFTEFEVIMVDDGSKDKSGQMCEEYAKKYPFFYHLKKENGGVSSARNVGIKAAQGAYIVFVDADDEVKPEFLEAFTEKERMYDLFIQSTTTITVEGKRAEVCLTEGVLRTPDEKATTILEIMEKDLPISVCNSLFKTSIIRDNGLWFDEEMVQCEDADFVVRYMAVCGDVYVSNIPNYIYYLPADEKTYHEKKGLRTSLKLLGNSYRLTSNEEQRKVFRHYYLSWANEELFYFNGEEEKLKEYARQFGELCVPYLAENERTAFRHRVFKKVCKSQKAEDVIKTARRVMKLYRCLDVVSLRHLFRKA